MSEVDAPGRFSVTVPGRAGLVGTLRVFASAVARHYGLSDDLVEDVKLAVSEASTDAVEAGAGGDVRLEMAYDDETLRCLITSAASADGAGAGRPSAVDLPEGVDPRALDRMQLVRALFADAERSAAGGVAAIRFSTASRTGESLG